MDTSILNENPDKVRVNEDMMRSYIELYKSVFHKEPNCASCSFSSDFRRLQNYFKQQHKTKIMSKSYKLNKRHSNEILRYTKDGKTYRIYGRDLNDDFAKEYLKNGTKKQIEERKSKFDNIPETKKNKAKKTKKQDKKK